MDVNEIQQYLPGNITIANAVMKEGQYGKIMPQLLTAGLEPASPSWVMDARNKAVGTDAEKALWKETGFDTDFGVAADDKTVWLFPHSKHLRAITPQTKLVEYGIPLKDKDDFKNAIAIPRSEFGDYLGKPLTREQFHDSPTRTLVWLPHLAEGDEQRMNTYENNAFTLGKRDFNYNEMLGFYVPETEKPNVRALVFGRAINGASAGGSRNLDNYYARLVGVRGGVAPEGREHVSTGSNGSLEATVRSLMTQRRVEESELPRVFEIYEAQRAQSQKFK